MAAHAVWRHPDSDALSLLRTLGAYSSAIAAAPGDLKQAHAFCKEHFLHAKSMKEMQQLRVQLTTIVNRHLARDRALPSPASARGCALVPPDPAEERVLLQLLGAGMLDQVARVDWRRIRGQRSLRWVPYQPASTAVPGPLFVHPSSFVRGRDLAQVRPRAAPCGSPQPLIPLLSHWQAPDFVMYREVVEGARCARAARAAHPGGAAHPGPRFRVRRTYMRGVTAVDPSWLASLSAGTPMVEHSGPLESPAPVFDAQADELKCYVKAVFGARHWELPLQRVREAARAGVGVRPTHPRWCPGRLPRVPRQVPVVCEALAGGKGPATVEVGHAA